VADADVAGEGAVRLEQRHAADLDRPHRIGRVDEGRLEIPERPPLGEILEMRGPGRVVVVAARHLGATLAEDRRMRNAEHVGEARREVGEAQLGVHLPPPVGGDAGQGGEPVCHARGSSVAAKSRRRPAAGDAP
jgi:hypothetical protein